MHMMCILTTTVYGSLKGQEAFFTTIEIQLDATDLSRPEPFFLRISAPILKNLDEKTETETETSRVIVFSHGFGCNVDANDELVASWSSSGYVVLMPQHLDATNGDLAISNYGKSTVDQQRRLDMKRSLDAISQAQAEIADISYRRIVLDKVLAAGHSYGALTALSVGGATTLICNNKTSGK